MIDFLSCVQFAVFGFRASFEPAFLQSKSHIESIFASPLFTFCFVHPPCKTSVRPESGFCGVALTYLITEVVQIIDYRPNFYSPAYRAHSRSSFYIPGTYPYCGQNIYARRCAQRIHCTHFPCFSIIITYSFDGAEMSVICRVLLPSTASFFMYLTVI